jgi:hypothetical protein
MESVKPPLPVAFELDPAEIAEVRKSILSGSKTLAWIMAFNLLFGLANGALRLMTYGVHDILAWAFIGAYIVLGAIMLTTVYLRLSDFRRRTHREVVFGDQAIDVIRSPRKTETVTYGRIARVRILPNVIVIERRWSTAIGIPRRVLADDGEQLVRFFEDRLVGKRMLQRQSPSTVIVNTASA